MDRSLAFYRDVLGMQVGRDMEAGPDGPLARVTGLKDCVARILHLESGGSMLELLEYRQPEARPPSLGTTFRPRRSSSISVSSHAISMATTCA